jgi:uncharacterized membrane protein (UPF0136 family)
MNNVLKYIMFPALGNIVGTVGGKYAELDKSIIYILRYYVVGLIICSVSINFLYRIITLKDFSSKIISLISIVVTLLFFTYINGGTNGTEEDEQKISDLIDIFSIGFFLMISILDKVGHIGGLTFSLTTSVILNSFNQMIKSERKDIHFSLRSLFKILFYYFLGVVVAYLINFKDYKLLKIAIVSLGITSIFWITFKRLFDEKDCQLIDSRTASNSLYCGILTIIFIKWIF